MNRINNNSYPLPHWGSGTYYGDGSGGEYSSFPLIRRCGVGVCVIDSNGNITGLASFNLPGEIQTVPRAEYFAFYYVIQQALIGAVIVFVTDHKPLFEVFNKGIETAKLCINHDLLVPIFKSIEDKSLQVTMKWMPSHRTEDTLPAGVSLTDLMGNNKADLMAGQAASRHCIDLNIAASVLFYSSLIKRIQKRLACILCSLPNRPKMVPRNPVVKDKIEAVMHRSAHVCFTVNNRVHCARCKSNFSLHTPNLQDWLNSPCLAIGSDIDRPIPIPFDVVHIGKLVIHSSHKLRIYRGLIFCNKCGSISRYSKLGLLAQICEPPKYYGSNNLVRLNRGQLPINVDVWPADADNGTQYNMLELFGELPLEHRDRMEVFAYDLHHMTQQVHYSPPVSPYISSAASSSMSIDEYIEDEPVGTNGDVDMLLPSDSD